MSDLESAIESAWDARDTVTPASGDVRMVVDQALGLRAENPAITIALTDPEGAALYSWFANGELSSQGSSVSEGIGQSRITANLEGLAVDAQFRVPDAEGLHWVRRLNAEEGLCLGLSSGINIAGAVRLGKQMGPGNTIVTILCDSGLRYLSTIYNPEWLAARGFAPIT